VFILKIADILFFWLHILIITFNLFGWILPAWRKYHLMIAGLTIFSWLILGIWYGFGYCFLTDWHWEVKYRLGERGLPASFVKYFFDNYTSLDISAAAVDQLTGICFAAAVLVSLILVILGKRKSRSMHG
jgi:hypothetical protein